MCTCKESKWSRTWYPSSEDTQDGTYPQAEHAPGCDEYRQEEFARIEHDGMFCIVEKHELPSMLEDGDDGYKVTMVMLTRDQFEKLPEFEGF